MQDSKTISKQLQELADKAGVKKRSLLSSLSHKNKGWARVEVEEDE